MFLIFLIFSLYIFADDNCCHKDKCYYEKEIKRYDSQPVFRIKNDAVKMAVKANNSVNEYGYNSVGYSVSENDGFYSFSLDYTIKDKCLYYEIKSYEIDYSKNLNSYEALKKLNAKNNKNINTIYINDDNYLKKISVKYVVPFKNKDKCIKDVIIKREYFYLADKYNADKYLTSIENFFKRAKIPYVFIYEDEDRDYIYADYIVCDAKYKYPFYEMKRYESFYYRNRYTIENALVFALKSIENSGDYVFYYDIDERDGYYYFYIDYLSNRIDESNFKNEILYYRYNDYYSTENDAVKKMNEKKGSFSSSGFYPLEATIIDNDIGYSYSISYISPVKINKK